MYTFYRAIQFEPYNTTFFSLSLLPPLSLFLLAPRFRLLWTELVGVVVLREQLLGVLVILLLESRIEVGKVLLERLERWPALWVHVPALKHDL